MTYQAAFTKFLSTDFGYVFAENVDGDYQVALYPDGSYNSFWNKGALTENASAILLTIPIPPKEFLEADEFSSQQDISMIVNQAEDEIKETFAIAMTLL